MKSFSEIETVSKRSCKAAGFSWGISEEAGKNEADKAKKEDDKSSSVKK